MTQYSYFWNGTAHGDAIEAPYSVTLLSDILKTMLSTDGGYVLPNVANYLAVTTTGPSMSVDVNTGQAFVFGKYYKNTASVNLTLNVGHTKFPRWDRVGLLVNTADQTIRLVTIEGVPSDIPDIPTYSSCYNFMPLARVYVPAGATTVTSSYIHDERVFAHNVYHQNNGSTQNDWEDPTWVSATNMLNNGWRLTGSIDVASYIKGEYSTIGKLVTLTWNGLAAAAWSKTFLTSTTSSIIYTMRLFCRVLVGELVITCGTTTIKVPRTKSFVEIIIRESATGFQTVSLSASSTGTEVELQDTTIAQGFIPARPSWDTEGYIFSQTDNIASSSAASTGTLTVVLDTTIYFIPNGVRALNVLLRSRDSGSAASSTTNVSVCSPTSNVVYLTSWNAGRTNDKWEYVSGLVYLENNVYATEGAFSVEVNVIASGVGTTEYDIDIIGVVV